MQEKVSRTNINCKTMTWHFQFFKAPITVSHVVLKILAFEPFPLLCHAKLRPRPRGVVVGKYKTCQQTVLVMSLWVLLAMAACSSPALHVGLVMNEKMERFYNRTEEDTNIMGYEQMLGGKRGKFMVTAASLLRGFEALF